MVWLALLLALGEVRVGSPGPQYTIAAALAAARAGDTLRVPPGTYRERLVLERAIVLLGEGRPTIDGGGVGNVVEIRGRGVVLSGFRIRGSGRYLEHEDAGILVAADSCVIADNVLEDVLFGINLKQSRGTRIAGNEISGKERPLGQRGDGIRLWYGDDARIERNVVRDTRDVVVYFSTGVAVRQNRVTGGRYGLHYMYSSDQAIERNELEGNDVAAFIMYSSDIILSGNIFAGAAGPSGFGLGLKDTDGIVVVGNLIVQNQVGLYLDNSPSRLDGRNVIRDNTLAFNDVGVSLLPSVRQNRFTGNTFVGNVRDVSVSGGGNALANGWSGNRWDAAASWDADRDGVLDAPHRVDRLSDDLFARHPDLRLFELSPAASTLDALGRFFPLLAPQPIVVDSTPAPLAPSFESAGVGVGPGPAPDRGSGGTALAAALWLGLAGLSLWGVRRWPL